MAGLRSWIEQCVNGRKSSFYVEISLGDGKGNRFILRILYVGISHPHPDTFREDTLFCNAPQWINVPA